MAEGQGDEPGETYNPGTAQYVDVSIDSFTEAYIQGLLQCLLKNIQYVQNTAAKIIFQAAKEYESLDHTLDEIDTWMTKLEQQNESLNAQLDELLESSKQTRQELLESSENGFEQFTNNIDHAIASTESMDIVEHKGYTNEDTEQFSDSPLNDNDM